MSRDFLKSDSSMADEEVIMSTRDEGLILIIDDVNHVSKFVQYQNNRLCMPDIDMTIKTRLFAGD